MARTDIAGNNLMAVEVVEMDNPYSQYLSKKIIYRIMCCKCGTIFSHFNYDRKAKYYCDDCKIIVAKEKTEKRKAEEKERERKILKKYKRAVEETKKIMCNEFCLIPKAFKDEAVKQEACTNCPFLRIEVWDD